MSVSFECHRCKVQVSLIDYQKSHFCPNCGTLITTLMIRANTNTVPQNAKIEQVPDTHLESAYYMIREQVPYARIDPLEVVKEVEAYRRFWKPSDVKVILLAESHVYTSLEDYSVRVKIPSRIPLLGYPAHFVRFVYCLGYGESNLLDSPVKPNSGTWQYWEIFSSCVSASPDDLGFDHVLRKKTQNILDRIRNKILLLEEMKRRGIWLLDASIVGLYKNDKEKSNKNESESIIRICWDNHIRRTIEDANPNGVIVIGKGVNGVVGDSLCRMRMDTICIPQPNSRGSSEYLLNNFRQYHEFCSKHIK